MIEMVILHFGRNGIGEEMVKGTKVTMFVTIQVETRIYCVFHKKI